VHCERMTVMQQINFYRLLTKKSPYSVDAKHLRIILLGWVAFLMFIFIVQLLYFMIERLYLSHMEYTEKKITQNIQTLIQSSPKIKLTNQLNNTIAMYTKKINIQTALVQQVLTYQPQVTPFSPADYLNELSQAIVPNVWLTQISLLNHGSKVALQGLTLSTAQLMRFTSALQKQPHFNHKPFYNIGSVDTEKNQPLVFTLATQDEKHD